MSVFRRSTLPEEAVYLRLLSFFACALVLSHRRAFAASSARKSPRWLTLTGNAPLVVARGGFSGFFPDSSQNAYALASLVSLPDLVSWCDVQLTKDGTAICFPDLNLDNASTIRTLPHAKESTYNVNGDPTNGYFSVDYTWKQLQNVYLTQGIASRLPYFGGYLFFTPKDLFGLGPAGLWLNIQHDAFYSQHNLSMRNFILRASKSLTINYLSSPELNFLKGLAPRFASTTTKLIFRFMDENEIEPTTNQTYGSLKRNLTFIKSFASGILVPKTYIWPEDGLLYLSQATTLVNDAHEARLLVFAADFANDNVISYNYSYNPVAEYLQFIDNGNFSVDGVLSDFPVTASEAIGCFAHLGKNVRGQAKPLVISNHGASGDYPACTDLAYTKAISDGADVVDCTVQMSKDRIPFCLRTINLMESTTILETKYYNQTQTIPELQSDPGIFTFHLTWEEIQELIPAIWNPFTDSRLVRNPKFQNAGKLISLDEFLAMTKNATSLSGVLIRIENATYLAKGQGLNVTEAVLSVLDKAGYSNQTAQKLMIQSTHSSVLRVFKGKGYELVYDIGEAIRDASTSSLDYVKSLASTVVIRKGSVYSLDDSFLTRETDVVKKLHAFNLTVFVKRFSNEFISSDYDFYGDTIQEINTFVQSAGVDGIVTDFPQTVVSYKKNRCIPVNKSTPGYMQPATPGFLVQYTAGLPPADAPSPVLNDDDVAEPPLPPVKESPSPSLAPSSASGSSATPASGKDPTAAKSAFMICSGLWPWLLLH